MKPWKKGVIVILYGWRRGACWETEFVSCEKDWIEMHCGGSLGYCRDARGGSFFSRGLVPQKKTNVALSYTHPGSRHVFRLMYVWHVALIIWWQARCMMARESGAHTRTVLTIFSISLIYRFIFDIKKENYWFIFYFSPK